MDISVIICTYNRADLLSSCLRSLCMQKGVDFSWEVIVVDNNSDDHTKEVIKQYTGVLPNLKYVFEPKQGISFAKNRGVRASCGDILAFTDDDVVVDVGWLKNIKSFFDKNHDAFCVGGKILPLWEVNPPKWLTKNFYPYLALLDIGESVVEMKSPDLWGANLSLRREAFDKYGPFNEKVGRKAKQLYSGEETLLLDNILKDKKKIFYVPWIKVKHFVPKERINKTYFRKWKFYHGKTKAVILDNKSHRKFLNVPLHMFRFFFFQLIKYIGYRISFRSNAFLEELELISYAGYIFKRLEGV